MARRCNKAPDAQPPGSGNGPLFQPGKDGIRVAVRLQPKAGANKIDGIDVTAAGRERLRVRVTQAPENGKANKVLLRLLAKDWGLAASDLTLAAGAQSRDKMVLLRAGDTDLLAHLRQWRRQFALKHLS